MVTNAAEMTTPERTVTTGSSGALAHVGARRRIPDRAILLVGAVNLTVGLLLAHELELLATGFMIIAYVLIHMATPAKIAGVSWLLVGAGVLHLSRRHSAIAPSERVPRDRH